MASAVANNIPNTIVVSENRNVVNDFRNWYKEKIIDTGVSKKFEEGLVEYHRTQEKLLNVFGKVVTVVLAIYPADGPLGEAVAMAASPFISKGVALKNKINERNIITAKRNFEANFIKADGSSEKVVLPEMSLDGVLNEGKELIGMISDLDVGSSKGVKR